MGRWSGKSCRLSTMMLMTSLFFLVEIIVGYITNSIALVADSFHMLSDLVALVVGLASVKISKKTTKGNTFGWQRAEVLGALINCVFLLALCFSILVESLKRLVELERVENPMMMLVVGGLGLLVNLLGLGLFGSHGHSHGGSHGHSHGGEGHGHSHGHGHGHSHGKHPKDDADDHYEKKMEAKNGSFRTPDDHKMILNGDLGESKCLVDPVTVYATSVDMATPTVNGNTVHDCNTANSKNQNRNSGLHDHEVYSIGDGVEIDMKKSSTSESMNMRGVFLHVLGDALGSVVVIISGVVIWLVEGEWKYYLDPVLSMILVVIILYTTVPLFKETAHILLQAVPRDICVDAIAKDLLEIEGLIGVHECHIWQLSGRRLVASAHVHCRDMRDYMTMASKIKDVFHRAGVHSTTIQPEIYKDPIDLTACSIQCPALLRGTSCLENTCCKGKTHFT